MTNNETRILIALLVAMAGLPAMANGVSVAAASPALLVADSGDAPFAPTGENVAPPDMPPESPPPDMQPPPPPEPPPSQPPTDQITPAPLPDPGTQPPSEPAPTS